MVAARAPGLAEALERALAEGTPYLILDGKVVDTDRCREKAVSRKGKTIDVWYAGKTHDFGANIQALFYPSGIPLWVSDVLPGNVHDLAAARENVLGVLRPFLDAMPVLADPGYESAGHAVHVPAKKPVGVKELDIDTRARNALLRSVRCLGERGFALLTQRWRTLQHVTASLGKIGLRGIYLTGGVQVPASPGPAGRRPFQAGRASAGPRWRGRCPQPQLAGHQVAVAHRVMGGRELEQPVEHQAAAGRAAAVEAEHELIQVAGQVRRVHRALVGAQQPPLGQRGDPVNGGQQLAGILAAGAGGALAALFMGVAEAVQPVIALPRVGDDAGARLDVAGDERAQRGSRRVRQDRHPAPADTLRFPDLHRNADQRFLAPGPAAARPRLLAPDERLIHLHRVGQQVPARPHQHRAQPAQHRPCGLAGADVQRALQALRRDAILLGREQPARREPDRQRRPRPVEDRARRHRGPPAAARALEPAIAKLPPAATAGRAGEAIWPAQPFQGIQAGRVGGEPGLELAR